MILLDQFQEVKKSYKRHVIRIIWQSLILILLRFSNFLCLNFATIFTENRIFNVFLKQIFFSTERILILLQRSSRSK